MRLLPLLLSLCLVAGCGGSPGTPAAPPGSPEVYQRIQACSDCAELQREFDTAAANHDRDFGMRHRADLAEIDAAYMKAADERMRAIGCYKK